MRVIKGYLINQFNCVIFYIWWGGNNCDKILLEREFTTMEILKL